MDYRITEASPDDASFIAEGVMDAIGEEICAQIGGGIENLPKIKELFTFLASNSTSQYSYRNSLIALAPNGERAGVIIAYDGACLHRMREDFVEKYNELFAADLKESEMDDETTPDQIYIDTLMVSKSHRRQGLGGKLIEAMVERHRNGGKPIGLLVDFSNPNARKLYVKMGFESKGTKRFCGVDMEHMQK